MASGEPITSKRVSRNVIHALRKHTFEKQKTRGRNNTSRYTNLRREGAESTQSKNNINRPLINEKTIIPIIKLLRINKEEYKIENIGRSLTPADVKILATYLIESTKLSGLKGALHSLRKTRKQSNTTIKHYTKSVRDVLKQISLIEPDVKNRPDYTKYIEYIQKILNEPNNYEPNIRDNFLFHKTLILSLNNDDVSEEEMIKALESVL